jgi:hypothetical protein
LARLLESLDPPQFVALREKYVAAFRKAHTMQIKVNTLFFLLGWVKEYLYPQAGC